jgi:hypothetical protein
MSSDRSDLVFRVTVVGLGLSSMALTVTIFWISAG